MNHTMAKINKDNANTQMYPLSIFLGAIGAILAALLINILVYFVFNGTVYAIMYAAVSIASYFGYKLGKAPRNKKMIATIIITSVLATLLMDFSFYGLMAASLEQSLSQFLSENMSGILGNEGISLLFLAIGIYVAWNVISKTSDKEADKFK